ncbi:type 2 lantipeptide synthetase LanM [Streptomyces tricolor]|nr:type 2 lantipeptide synthetase LanM [Streptomyces tricolor]
MRRDAELLAAALATPRFGPLGTLLDALDAWCRRTTARTPGLLAPGVLDVTQGALFGPLVSEAFTACAAGAPYPAEEECARWTGFLERFLERLSGDTGTCGAPPAGTSFFDRPSLRLPVTCIEAQDGETHNGRRRVLRVRLSGGGSIAYKPRPAGGEVLFLTPDTSVFALLLQPAARVRSRPSARAALHAGHRPGRTRVHLAGVDRAAGAVGGDPLGVRPAAVRHPPRPPSGGTVLAPGGLPRRRRVPLRHRRPRRGQPPGRDTARGPGTPVPPGRPRDLPHAAAAPYDTGLVADAAAGDHHHPGLEDRARWCTLDGPVACFTETADAGLRLVRRRRPCTRGGSRTVVSDTRGRTGYGPYLPSFLRGMFDAWTLTARHHDRIRAFLHQTPADTYVRVLLKPTAAYTETLADRLCATAPGSATAFGPAETAQLDAGDVPYFFRSVHGGPLLRVAETTHLPPPRRPAPRLAAVRRRRRRPRPRPGRAGCGAERRGRLRPRHRRGPARSAATASACRSPTGTPARHVSPGPQRDDGSSTAGPATRCGSAWSRSSAPPRCRRSAAACCAPTGRTRHCASAGSPPISPTRRPRSGCAPSPRRACAGWRTSWRRTAGRGHALAGPAAAAAACRLVQHAEGPLGFQYECLDLIERAACDGDLPLRQIAYVTDALRIHEGRPQVYGTKFRMHEGELEPCPIEQPDRVDELRHSLGMEPLARYAARLRRRHQPPAG